MRRHILAAVFTIALDTTSAWAVGRTWGDVEEPDAAASIHRNSFGASVSDMRGVLLVAESGGSAGASSGTGDSAGSGTSGTSASTSGTSAGTSGSTGGTSSGTSGSAGSASSGTSGSTSGASTGTSDSTGGGSAGSATSGTSGSTSGASAGTSGSTSGTSSGTSGSAGSGTSGTGGSTVGAGAGTGGSTGGTSSGTSGSAGSGTSGTGGSTVGAGAGTSGSSVDASAGTVQGGSKTETGSVDAAKTSAGTSTGTTGKAGTNKSSKGKSSKAKSRAIAATTAAKKSKAVQIQPKLVLNTRPRVLSVLSLARARPQPTLPRVLRLESGKDTSSGTESRTKPGIPTPIVQACGGAIASAAYPLGAVHVRVTGSGSMLRLAGGSASAPVFVRIRYGGMEGGMAVRQARIHCEVDSHGRVLRLR